MAFAAQVKSDQHVFASHDDVDLCFVQSLRPRVQQALWPTYGVVGGMCRRARRSAEILTLHDASCVSIGINVADQQAGVLMAPSLYLAQSHLYPYHAYDCHVPFRRPVVSF